MPPTTLFKINVDTNGNTVLPQLASNAGKADVALKGLSRDANGKLRDANGRFVSLNKNVKGVGGSLHNSRGKARSFFSTIDNGSRRSISMMSRLRGIAAGIGLTLGAGALVAGTVGTGAGFEKSMSNVQALSNATQTEMVSLESAARKSGATTEHTARASADAMGYLSLAGYNANQQMAALPATLDLASAGSIELARSADIATNILSQYRMKAKDTNIVVDQLAFTQSRFNTNIEEASEAMNYLGPTAAAMGISLSESNATIGLMANNGLKGTLATRAFGSSMVRLTKPTSQMQKVMKQLNIDFFNSEGRFVGVAGMVGLLNNRLDGMNDKQRQAALSTLFGAEAIQEINILLAEGADKIKYWTGELDNAEGTARRMANVKLDNLAGDFQILKSTTQDLSLSLYDEMGPALRAVTQEATLFVRGMDTKQVGLTLRNTIFQLRSGLIWLGQHKTQIVNIGKAMITLKAASMAYSVGLRAEAVLTSGITLLRMGQTVATTGATVATIGLNTALKANPLGLFLGVLTAVVAGVTLFRDRTREASEAQQKFNAKKIGWKNLGKTVDSLSEDTAKDTSLYGGGLNERQQISLNQRSKSRIEELEDRRSDISLELKELEADRNAERNKLASLRSMWGKANNGYFSYKGSDGNQKKEKIGTYVGTNRKGQVNWGLGYTDVGKQLLNSTKSGGAYDKNIAQLGTRNNQVLSLIKSNASLVEKTKGLLPELADGTVPTPSGVVDESGMTDSIISGGAQQRVINIKLDKFQENVNFNIQGEISELRDGMEEMRELINEQLMRVLNSANQLANG